MSRKDINKVWWLRLRCVHELVNWVLHKLNTKHETWGSALDKKDTPEGRKRKAMQYVIDHIALGKMLYPFESVDPLFTSSQYEDESMQLQLLPGKYPDFQAQVQRKIRRISEFDPRTAPSVRWGVALRRISPEARAFLNRIAENIPEGENRSDAVIGLVLRYKCMGGFNNNFHGSVPAAWAEALDGYVECFASPFNHKLDKYHSMFDEDKVFGSEGNFFSMLAQNGGILPPGQYQMNPPWMNAAYEQIQSILEASLPKGGITVLLIGPNWKGTSWIDGINTLKKSDPLYRKHSIKSIKTIGYIQDMTACTFTKHTVCWLFSTTPMHRTPVARLIA